MFLWPGSLLPFSGSAISEGKLIELSEEVMRDMLKIIVFCTQDKLDPLGRCVWTQRGQNLCTVYEDNNDNIMIYELALCYRKRLHYCICRKVDNLKWDADGYIFSTCKGTSVFFLFKKQCSFSHDNEKNLGEKWAREKKWKLVLSSKGLTELEIR